MGSKASTGLVASAETFNVHGMGCEKARPTLGDTTAWAGAPNTKEKES